MTFIYNRPYKVKTWIVPVGLNEKQMQIFQKCLPKSEELVNIEWPSLKMPEKLKEFGGRGYAEHVFCPRPFFLDLVLSLRSMVELTREVYFNAQLSPNAPYTQKVNRRVEIDADFVRIGDEILACNDDLTLSQVFNTGENVSKSFVSVNADVSICSRLAEKVISVGAGENFTINVENVSDKELMNKLTTLFKAM